MRKRWVWLVVFAIVLLAATYISTYFMLVDRFREHFDNRRFVVYQINGYIFNGKLPYFLYRPIHLIDRRLRPEYWSGVIDPHAEEAWEPTAIRCIGVAADALMAITGVVILLYAYRLLGKSAGADEKYDEVMTRHSSTYRIVGWSIVVMAIIGLISR